MSCKKCWLNNVKRNESLEQQVKINNLKKSVLFSAHTRFFSIQFQFSNHLQGMKFIFNTIQSKPRYFKFLFLLWSMVTESVLETTNVQRLIRIQSSSLFNF